MARIDGLLMSGEIDNVRFKEIYGEDAEEVMTAIIAKIKELLPHNPFYKENLKAYLERFSPEDSSPLTYSTVASARPSFCANTSNGRIGV